MRSVQASAITLLNPSATPTSDGVCRALGEGWPFIEDSAWVKLSTYSSSNSTNSMDRGLLSPFKDLGKRTDAFWVLTARMPCCLLHVHYPTDCSWLCSKVGTSIIPVSNRRYLVPERLGNLPRVNGGLEKAVGNLAQGLSALVTGTTNQTRPMRHLPASLQDSLFRKRDQHKQYNFGEGIGICPHSQGPVMRLLKYTIFTDWDILKTYFITDITIKLQWVHLASHKVSHQRSVPFRLCMANGLVHNLVWGKCSGNTGSSCLYLAWNVLCVYTQLLFGSTSLRPARQYRLQQQPAIPSRPGLVTIMWVMGSHTEPKFFLSFWFIFTSVL